MKRIYITTPSEASRLGIPHRLFLHPQSDKEREVLTELAENYKTANAGYSLNGQLLHVGIEIEPLEGE